MGYCQGLAHAANLLPDHITKNGLGTTTKGVGANLFKTGYQLYFVPPEDNCLRAGFKSVGNMAKVFGLRKGSTRSKEAHILAGHMEDAHKAELYVDWTTHRGGAFTLTEAMSILADKGINLERRQSIFLSGATSSLDVADRLRRKLNMFYEDSWYNQNDLNVGELVGGSGFGLFRASTGMRRLAGKNKDLDPHNKDSYNVFQMVGDVAGFQKNAGIAASLGAGTPTGTALIAGLVTMSPLGAYAVGAVAAGVSAAMIAAENIPTANENYSTVSGRALVTGTSKAISATGKAASKAKGFVKACWNRG